jgi:hypothetical protein
MPLAYLSDDRMFRPSKHESALAHTGTRQFGLGVPTIDGGFMSSFGYCTGTSRPMLRLRTAPTMYEVSMHDRWRTPSHVCLLPVLPDLMIRLRRSAVVESYTSRGIDGQSGLSSCLRMSTTISAAVVSVSDVKRRREGSETHRRCRLAHAARLLAQSCCASTCGTLQSAFDAAT